jgi:hypothetical protein
MSKGIFVRFIVPTMSRDGKVEYRVETRQIRLPLKRNDRLELKTRLG